MNYIKLCVLDPVVLGFALLQIIKKRYITFLILVIPAYLVIPAMSFKFIYFGILCLAILVFTLIVCLILKSYDIYSLSEQEVFYDFSARERGAAIGDVI